MFAKFRMLSFMLLFVALGSKLSFADNVLNGQHSANVQLVLDNSGSHEVYVELYNTFVYFYVDGSNVPLVSTYDNTLASLSIEVVAGPHGDSVVINDHSTAYLAGVAVHIEFDGGDGNDSVDHGISYWTGVPIANWVTSFPCTLHGHGGLDNLKGGAGDDLIYGHSGVGLLSGGAGDDVLVGGSSLDSIHGDAGDDTIDGGSGWNFLHGDDGNDIIKGGSSIDNIQGGSGDDTIKGLGSNDTLDGGDGNDLIHGGPGNDTINGGDGDDVIKGESGLDQINGGAGDDVMDGAGSPNFNWGFGLFYPTHHDNADDILEGGPGADWFKNYMHVKPSNGGFAQVADQDTLLDYDPGEGDIATQAIWKMTVLPVVYFVF